MKKDTIYRCKKCDLPFHHGESEILYTHTHTKNNIQCSRCGYKEGISHAIKLNNRSVFAKHIDNLLGLGKIMEVINK